MPAPKYLKQRNGVWYVQMRVPANLRPQLGATLIQSLKTRDETEANRKRHAVITDFQARMDEATRAPAPPSRLESLLERALVLFSTEGGQPDPEFFEPSQARVDFDAEVQSILDSYPVDARGEPVVPPGDLRMIRRISSAGIGKDEPFAGQLVSSWLESQADRKDLKNATLDAKEKHVQLFLELAGTNVPVSELTPDLAYRYVNEVLNPKAVGLQTKQNMLQNCGQYCRWLVASRLLTANPFEGMDVLLKGKSNSKEQSRPWTGQELGIFLDAVPAGGDIWSLAALMAYTGCRPRELCDVKIDDVTEESITILKSKTSAGRRTLPIHPVIAPLVRHLVATSRDGYLMADQVPAGDDNNRYKLLGKRLNSVRERLKFGPSLIIYGLRSSVATQMREAGHPEWICKAVLGHEGASILDKHYVKSQGLALKTDALRSVSYGAVDSKVSGFIG